MAGIRRTPPNRSISTTQCIPQTRVLPSTKPGNRGKICDLEAWVKGAASVTASHGAATLAEAIHAAADQLERLIAREIRQLDHDPGDAQNAGDAQVRPSTAPK